ncbi:ASCH domain-containing protein [Vibrio sp. SCSIO 43136]|uniref:ASCH domain-containing protein n=1 Tax=Vibrio sp. SCSIO 43136 TaxID=2819101 RepID=UPI002074F8BF|nr:ASCH domain-containing protein [Vibrio sp. SCSIO 43136]USD67078.1 ASCH domain-containing protein [Vibrio sp. SCSIO 43136]
MKPHHQAYLDRYLSTLSPQELEKIPDTIAEYYCADEYNANECARLVDQGIKTASCSLKAAYTVENEPFPQVGRLTVVLDWDENPVCVIRLTEVTQCPFDEVSEEFAQAEGEGDGTYEWWRQAHIEFFTQYAKEIGADFNLSSELVLERFEKVYPLEK